MFNVIKDWEYLGQESKTIKIARSTQSFSSSYFDGKDRHEQLTAFCRDFFKDDIRINIVAGNPSDSKKRKRTGSKQHPSPTTAGQPDLPGPVRDIIHMFQGELKKD